MGRETNPREFDLNRIRVSFAKFQKLGIRLHRKVADWLEHQFDGLGDGATLAALHTENPLLGLIRTLGNSEWQKYLRDNHWIHRAVSEVLLAVLVQQTDYDFCFRRDSKSERIRKRKMDEVSLVARRYLLWLAGQGEEEAVASPRASDFAGWFPRPDAAPGGKHYNATDYDSWLKFQNRLSNLLSHKYLYSRGNDERDSRFGLGSDDEEYEDTELGFEEAEEESPSAGNNVQRRRAKSLHAYHRDRETPVNPAAYRQFEREAVCTGILSVHSYNEPIGLMLLHRLCTEAVKNPKEDDENAGFHLIAILSIEHGIPPPDVLHLGLEPGVSAFGWINWRMLVLNLGSSFYKSGARAFDPNPIYQPLSQEAWILFKKALRQCSGSSHQNVNIAGKKRDSRPKTLGDLIGLQPKAFRVMWRKFIQKHLPGFATYSTHLHQVWENAALLDAGIPRPLAGMLRTKPLRGTHAECSYLSIPHDELIAASIHIRNALRKKAGLPSMKLAQAHRELYCMRVLLGTLCPTLEEYWQKTERYVDACQNHNEVVACIVRFMRGLGIRYSTIHYQPAYYAVELPEPAFEILDKPVNGSDRARYIPITAEISEFVMVCAQMLGENSELLYHDGVASVPFGKFRKRADVEPILEEGGSARQAGRTAFFSALVRQGCGEAIRNFLMGHGSSIFQPYSEHGLLSVGDWIRQAREPVETIYRDCRVNEIAIKLANKVRRLCLPATVAEKSIVIPALPRHGVSYYGANLDAGSISPPLPIEHWLLTQIRRRLPLRKIEATPQALVRQLAFVHGIPSATLLRLAPYIRFRDFVSFGGWIYLLMPMEHEDKGGLSRYPVRICRSGKADPAIAILSRLWARLKKINTGVHDTTLIERAVLVCTPVDAKSSYQKRRRSTGKAAALHYAFHAPNPLSEKSLAKAFLRLLEGRRVKSLLVTKTLIALASRLSEIACAWQHPAIVFGALRAQSKRGLNHYRIADLFQLIDTNASAPRVTVSQTPLPPERAIPRLTFRALEDCQKRLAPATSLATRQDRARAVARILSEADIHPDYRILRGLLKRSGINLTSEEIYFERLTHGLARESSPLPLFSTERIRKIIRRASRSIRRSDLKRQSWNRLQSRHLALRIYLYFLADGGFRLSEPAILPREGGAVVHSSPYVFIKRGKTQNSRRVVTLPPHPLTGNLTRCLRIALIAARTSKKSEPLLFLSKNPASDGKVVNRELNAVTGGLISAHDLRHHLAFHSVQAILSGHLQHGNYHTIMTTLARRLGHGSMSVTEYSYLGTAVSALRPPAHTPAPPNGAPSGLAEAKMKCVHGMLTQRGLGSLLSQIASGDLSEQQQALRKLRKFENQLRTLGRSKAAKCQIVLHPLHRREAVGKAGECSGATWLNMRVDCSDSLLPRAAEIIELAIRLGVNVFIRTRLESARILMARLSFSVGDGRVALKSLFKTL